MPNAISKLIYGLQSPEFIKSTGVLLKDLAVILKYWE